jgi:hypothetical protein
MGKIRHIRLRKRIVKILKSFDGDDLPTAQALLDLLLDSGMSPLCCKTKGIGSIQIKTKNCGGDTYTADAYYLESEEAFNEWVDSKLGG